MNKRSIRTTTAKPKSRDRKIEKLSKGKSPEERFWELCEGLEIVLEKGRFLGEGVIKFYKNGQLHFHYVAETKYLWCSDDYVWSVLKQEFKMEYDEVGRLIEEQMGIVFNCKGIKVGTVYVLYVYANGEVANI